MNVDMIVQNISEDGRTDMTFSLPVESIKKPSRFLLVGIRGGDVVYQTLLLHEPEKQKAGP